MYGVHGAFSRSRNQSNFFARLRLVPPIWILEFVCMQAHVHLCLHMAVMFFRKEFMRACWQLSENPGARTRSRQQTNKTDFNILIFSPWGIMPHSSHTPPSWANSLFFRSGRSYSEVWGSMQVFDVSLKYC